MQTSNQQIPFSFFFSGDCLTEFSKELINLKRRQYTCTDEELPYVVNKIKELESSLRYTQALIR